MFCIDYFSLDRLSRHIYIFTTYFVSSKQKYSNPKQNIKAKDLFWYINFTRWAHVGCFQRQQLRSLWLAAWLEESEVPQLLLHMSWTELRRAQPGISLCRDAKYQICVTINKPCPHELVEWTPSFIYMTDQMLLTRVQKFSMVVLQCNVKCQCVCQTFSQSSVQLPFVPVQTDCGWEMLSCTLWKSRRKLMLEALCGAHHSACETVRLQTKQATNSQSLIIIPAWFVLIWVRGEVVKGGYMLIVRSETAHADVVYYLCGTEGFLLIRERISSGMWVSLSC